MNVLSSCMPTEVEAMLTIKEIKTIIIRLSRMTDCLLVFFTTQLTKPEERKEKKNAIARMKMRSPAVKYPCKIPKNIVENCVATRNQPTLAARG